MSADPDPWPRAGSPVRRWHASPRPVVHDVHVNHEQPRVVLPERSFQQSAEHDVRPPLVHRLDRLVLHPLQRRFVTHVDRVLSPFHHLHRIDTGAERYGRVR